MTITIGSLFSGIGGLELGLEWGLRDARTVWQVEIDPYARTVLGKHWPEVRRIEDVRHVNANTVPGVDLICGGFPCQPHSLAGKRLASADDRDLWGEFARIIGELRPRWVVAENVPGLLSSTDPAFSRDHPGGFFGRVLRDLARLGFDAEWHRFPAAAVGAHHRRERIFLVAHALRAGREEQHTPPKSGRPGHGAGCSDALRHPTGEGLPDWAGGTVGQPSPLAQSERPGWWTPEPGFRLLADGIPGRVGALRTLGNAVLPQAAAVIGIAIKEAEEHIKQFGILPDRIVRTEHVQRVRDRARIALEATA